MTKLNDVVQKVTARLQKRSLASRRRYEDGISRIKASFLSARSSIEADDQDDILPLILQFETSARLMTDRGKLETQKSEMKEALLAAGAPTVDQLSLPSGIGLIGRELTAQSAILALSNPKVGGAFFLSDQPVMAVGYLAGALQQGHVPSLFGASLSMPDDGPLLADWVSSHIILEVLGLQIPGSSFLRSPEEHRLFSQMGAECLMALVSGGLSFGVAELVSVHAVVNAAVSLLATAASSTMVLHLTAIAHSAGILLTREDWADLASVAPMLFEKAPATKRELQAFQDAGAIPALIASLHHSGHLNTAVRTVFGDGLDTLMMMPAMRNGELFWAKSGVARATQSFNPSSENTATTAAYYWLSGDLGDAIMVGSTDGDYPARVEAEAIVFDTEDQFLDRFQGGELNRDFIAVFRFHGPKASGMILLERCQEPLKRLHKQGFRVGLITDGGVVGQSPIPAAVHVCPEAAEGGLITRIRSGDRVRLDGPMGLLAIDVTDSELRERTAARSPLSFKSESIHPHASFFPNLGSTQQGSCLWGDP